MNAHIFKIQSSWWKFSDCESAFVLLDSSLRREVSKSHEKMYREITIHQVNVHSSYTSHSTVSEFVITKEYKSCFLPVCTLQSCPDSIHARLTCGINLLFGKSTFFGLLLGSLHVNQNCIESKQRTRLALRALGAGAKPTAVTSFD